MVAKSGLEVPSNPSISAPSDRCSGQAYSLAGFLWRARLAIIWGYGGFFDTVSVANGIEPWLEIALAMSVSP
jgi:hypothetical protein